MRRTSLATKANDDELIFEPLEFAVVDDQFTSPIITKIVSLLSQLQSGQELPVIV